MLRPGRQSRATPPTPIKPSVSPTRAKRAAAQNHKAPENATRSDTPEPLLRPESARSRLAVWTPSFWNAFRILVFVRLLAAFNTSPTHDCDEVYNYWEPLHLLSHRQGFQTWEWTPTYAIRSWTYELLHVPFVLLARLVNPSDKRWEFWAVRCALAVLSTFSECLFYRAVVDFVHARTGRYLLVLLIFSPGLFQAAPALLPSSFSMHLTTLALSFAMRPVGAKTHSRTLKVIVCFAVSVLVGWPFAAVLAIPFVVEELFLDGTDNSTDAPISRIQHRFSRMFRLALWPALTLIPAVILIDSFFYGRIVFVPFNIFAYNVLSDSAQLYGTEPTSYYLINLFLNFNVAFVMALLSLPMLLITRWVTPTFFNSATQSAKAARSSFVLVLIRLAPFYLWFALLLPQPHKEERFMFPIYPLICFNAAMTLNVARRWLEKLHFVITQNHHRSRTFALFTNGVLLAYALLGMSRMAAVRYHYNAPVATLEYFNNEELPRLLSATFPEFSQPSAQSPDHPMASSPANLETTESLASLNLTLCYGGEWHRFPSSFFAPSPPVNSVNFVKSDFSGILPKAFPEVPSSEPLWKATRIQPPGFNDRNQEELDRYVDLASCSYFIDLHFPARSTSEAKPPSQFEPVFCDRFVDAQESSRLTRSFYVPLKPWVARNRFGSFCLMKSKDLA